METVPAALIVIGTLLAGFGLISILNASIDSRPARGGMITVCVAALSLVLAWIALPGGFGLSDVPLAYIALLGTMT